MAIARPGRGPLVATPLSNHFGEDQYYRTGASNPRLRADPGAGPWRSKPLTAAVVAQRAAAELALGRLTTVYPGPNATRHLRHYLNNTGRDYEVDLEDMIRRVPNAKRAMVAEFRQAQRFIQSLPVGRHMFTSRSGESAYNYKSESADWFFAIGGYTYWGKGEAHITPSKLGKRYEVEFEYHLYDRYNWDGDKSVDIGGIEITDEFMAEFHLQGLAREFDCFGSVKRNLSWEGDLVVPPDQAILAKPGR
ncbi:MAG: hypothetical protein EOO77_00665 [Oxalobacteraceae bacterium]|nr:MAG: hypothetical protein EOO77_00665 [Oxalobacteraceae bacterium]